MKKTTPQKLSKRLSQYGALSIAIAGIADANSQIVYTDIIPDIDQDDGPSYLLNVNSEGSLSDTINDFEIHLDFGIDLKIRPLTGSNEVLGNPYSSGSTFLVYPFALDEGVPISDSPSMGTWFNNSYSLGYLDLNYSSGVRGYWDNVQDKYLGLRFNIGSNIHYGWARLTVGSSGSVWVIRDYAYNADPGDPINAGEGIPLGIDDNVFSGVKIVALNKSIALFNLPQQTNYRLFTIAGQSVLEGKIDTNIHTIEASTLANGIYIIELKDSTSNAVIRKKIVL